MFRTIIQRRKEFQSIYCGIIKEATDIREVGLLTIPAGANYVNMQALNGDISVYYKKTDPSGNEQRGLGYQQFGETFQESILEELVKLHPSYTSDLN